MDEILIGESRYISSKRAAEITGYAKDYIGQLCREGRVEARLVGRNWYVREAAIRDHRFGEEERLKAESELLEPLSVKTDPGISQETEPGESLEEETIVKKQVDDEIKGGEEPFNIAEQMQDAWKDWFSKNQEVDLAKNDDEEAIIEPRKPENRQEEVEGEFSTETEVPITIKKERNDLAHEIKVAVEPPLEEEEPTEPIFEGDAGRPRSFLVLQSALLAFALLIVILTSISIGILNIPNASITASATNFISGTEIYKK